MSREQRGFFLSEEPEAEPGQFGCPMLARVRVSAATVNLPAWRCSLGWAIRGELEAANCQATSAVMDCWKVHPERMKIVELPVPAVVEQKASAD